MIFDDFFKANEPIFNIENTLPVARPGLPFIALGVALVIIFLILGWHWPRNIMIVLTLFCVWFFRDPQRPTPPGDFGLSPADGQIIRVEQLETNPYIEGPVKKVSIFMNVFNVHVNRSPVSGRLVSQQYHPGSFLNASFDKASEENERNALVIEMADGRKVAVVQIAGLVARRIVSWVKPEDALERGRRFGMIRFGSRLDLYLPADAEIMVVAGQKVSAGTSPIWKF